MRLRRWVLVFAYLAGVGIVYGYLSSSGFGAEAARDPAMLPIARFFVALVWPLWVVLRLSGILGSALA